MGVFRVGKGKLCNYILISKIIEIKKKILEGNTQHKDGYRRKEFELHLELSKIPLIIGEEELGEDSVILVPYL